MKRCPTADAIRMRWYQGHNPLTLDELRRHIDNCLDCQWRNYQMTERAKVAEHPPYPAEDITIGDSQASEYARKDE